MTEWQPIETAPRDGTSVDLWIVGDPESIVFYCPVSKRHRDRVRREGRISDVWWHDGAWRPKSGTAKLFPIDAEITHWMSLPEPPK